MMTPFNFFISPHTGRSILGFLFFFSMTVFMVSCDKDGKDPEPEPEALEVKEYTQSRATAQAENDWVYFSFDSDKEVSGITEENKADRMDWDIAFNRFNIRTNSGLSGKGQGGALDTNSKDFNSISEAPTSGYTTDTELTLTGLVAGEVTEIPSSGNSILSEAIAFAGPPPTYTPTEHIYIMKTATGKYVKIQFLSYHNAEGQSGFMTFKYTYQPDGSTRLK